MAIEIRLAGPGDAAALAIVAAGVFDAPIAPERLAAFLADPSHLMVLAIDGGIVIGQARAIIHRHPDVANELYIDNLGVASAWRRQGIARAMLDRLIETGRDAGCGEAWVGTEIDNRAANALYRSVARGEAANIYSFDIRTPARRTRVGSTGV